MPSHTARSDVRKAPIVQPNDMRPEPTVRPNCVKHIFQGDSGGPSVCDVLGTYRYKLRGVTSFSEGCGGEGKLGVYTRVFSQVQWINDKLLQHDIKYIQTDIGDVQELIKFMLE